MGKIEQLADVASQLSDEQLDSLISYAASLKGPSYLEIAPAEARDAVERGLADLEAGRTVPMDQVLLDINTAIAGKR